MEIEYRKATINDLDAIVNLYKKVSRNSGGIARLESEISEDYIANLMSSAQSNGLEFVATYNSLIIAEIHAYPAGIAIFSHVLMDLTIVVDSDFQGRGIGKKIFNLLISTCKEELKHIKRIELFAKDSNINAIKMYQSLGFNIEGKLVNRINLGNGNFEADTIMGLLI